MSKAKSKIPPARSFRLPHALCAALDEATSVGDKGTLMRASVAALIRSPKAKFSLPNLGKSSDRTHMCRIAPATLKLWTQVARARTPKGTVGQLMTFALYRTLKPAAVEARGL